MCLPTGSMPIPIKMGSLHSSPPSEEPSHGESLPQLVSTATPIKREALAEAPAESVIVTMYNAAPSVGIVGVAEIKQVEVLKLKPEGNSDEMLQVVPIPVIVGTSSVAVTPSV